MTIAAAATTHGAADLSSAKRGVAPVSWYEPTRALSYNRLCFSEKVVERWDTRDVPYRPTPLALYRAAEQARMVLPKGDEKTPPATNGRRRRIGAVFARVTRALPGAETQVGQCAVGLST